MKKYKIKHYRSRIYNPIRGKVLKGVLIGIIVLSLFGIGWFAYEPLMGLVNEWNKEIINNDPIPEKEKEPAYEPLPEEFLDKGTAAVTVPENIFYSDTAYYTFLKSLDEEVTAVVIDLKTQSGTVTYSSEQVSVINAGAVNEKAADLEKRVKTARNFGLDVVLRIYAFEDSTAPYNVSSMAIRYESADGVLWLDDSVDNGGKPWLNPYSDTAQKYILDIVYDAIDAEADAILLEGVRFPDDEDSMDYAYFGVSAEGVSRTDILKQFTQRIYSSAVITDTDIIIGYDSYAVITGSDIYGESPLALSADGYAPYIDLNAFIGEKFSEDFYYKEMPEDAEGITELFEKIYSYGNMLAEAKAMPVISCEGFEKSQFNMVLNYLEENSSGCILVYYEPYFTGVEPEPEEEPQEETPAVVQPVTPAVPQTPVQPQTPSTEPEPETSQGSSSENEDEDSDPGVTIKDYTK